MSKSELNREKTIIRASIIGIVSNILLVIFKTVIGLFSNSIAIILDAVNNLSDVLSSVITIIGIKLAGKKPDKEHPYGHGRIEYISAMLIAGLILYAGITALIEAIKKIINPEIPDYSVLSIIIIVVAVIVKIVLGLYIGKVGRKVNSESLINSGKDALNDAIVSTSTIVAAFIFIIFNISLEAWIGVIISVIIIKSGFEILSKTLSSIIGERIDGKLASQIKEKINSHEGVRGTYDLMLHNYGPITAMGSVHIEVDDEMTAKQIHALTRHLSMDIYNDFGIILTIGIYASNTDDTEYMQIKHTINTLLEKYPEVLQMHGFYVDTNTNTITFDIVIDFEHKNPTEVREQIIKELKENYKNYDFDIVIDNDFSD